MADGEPAVSTSPVITNEDELRSLLRATLNAYPEMAGRFDADATMEKLQTWGVCSLDSLDAVLCDSAMVSELAAHLAPACPRVFVSLLRAQLEYEDGEEGGERGGGATEEDAATDWKKATASAPPVPSMMARFLWALRGSLLEFMVPPTTCHGSSSTGSRAAATIRPHSKKSSCSSRSSSCSSAPYSWGPPGRFLFGRRRRRRRAAFRRGGTRLLRLLGGGRRGVAVTLSTLQIATSYVTIFLFLPITPRTSTSSSRRPPYSAT